MRIDVVTIFPAWLDAARPVPDRQGRATSGLLEIAVHDLRDWTHDRHRTVDDTPYGGGAGMVMKPEPWGEALDALAVDGRPTAGGADPERDAVHPGDRPRARRARPPGVRVRPLRGDRPAGDRRRRDTTYDVRELSLGDFVLNGGEVAAAGGHRGGRPAAARLHGQPGVARRGVARGRACWSTPSTPSPPRGAAATCRRCCCPATTRAIAAWRHAESVRRTVAAPPGPRCTPAASVAPARDDLELRPRPGPTPASCSR